MYKIISKCALMFVNVYRNLQMCIHNPYVLYQICKCVKKISKSVFRFASVLRSVNV